MGFHRVVPGTPAQLAEYLEKLHKNRGHIKSVMVNKESGRLEIDLDGKANFFGYPDIYLPIKEGSIEEASAMVAAIMERSASGDGPSNADAQSLFEMIDPQGQ